MIMMPEKFERALSDGGSLGDALSPPPLSRGMPGDITAPVLGGNTNETSMEGGISPAQLLRDSRRPIENLFGAKALLQVNA